MIRIMDCATTDRAELFNRGRAVATPEIETAVQNILDNVRLHGDQAVLSYIAEFDGVALTELKVSEAELTEAYAAADPAFIADLERAADNIRAFHSRQIRNNFVITGENGVVLGQRIIPMECAGLYVPGGTASYPSSVLMNAIPAKLAGVDRIIMATPPGKDGKIAPSILTAARVAGVTDIYKMGGAQAIGAMAYGTETVPKVDKIVGPGNIFVATAKQKVYGLVDIDMIAGPSEILVVADATANPRHVAADLLSQAEHDRLATAVLVCDSMALAEAVSAELERQIPLLPRAEIARTSIDNNGKIIVAADLSEGIAIANEIAPEHLELCVEDPFAWLGKVRNAGSVFLGRHAPEALGDYWAGPNHTLPTLGTAKFSSPLSVEEFVKRSSFIYYTKDALEGAKDGIMNLARQEGLEAHARSIAVRFEDTEL